MAGILKRKGRKFVEEIEDEATRERWRGETDVRLVNIEDALKSVEAKLEILATQGSAAYNFCAQWHKDWVVRHEQMHHENEAEERQAKKDAQEANYKRMALLLGVFSLVVTVVQVLIRYG